MKKLTARVDKAYKWFERKDKASYNALAKSVRAVANLIDRKLRL